MKVEGTVTGIWGTKISIDRSKYLYGVREGSVAAGDAVSIEAESVNGRLLATSQAVVQAKTEERHDSILVCVAAKIAAQTLDVDSTDEDYEARAERVLAWIESKVKA